MKNYKEIVDYNVFRKVLVNIENDDGCDIERNVFYKVENTVKNIVSNNVWSNVAWNVRDNVGNKVFDNHNLFQYNSLRQYKDNL
jgi:hypothetical protein